MLYDLYRYQQQYDLLYDNRQLTCNHNITDNRPMNKRLVKIHKGVDNLLKFRVFDGDRKRAAINQLRISGTLINKENSERVLTTTATHSPTRGLFSFNINEGDLANLAPGFYDFVISGEEFAIPEQDGELVYTPFYTDQSENIRLEAEITTQGEKSPLPTIDLDDWSTFTLITVDDVLTKLHYNTPIPASRLKNYTNPLHTFAVTAENFRGRLYIRGSLEQTPPTASEFRKYFEIAVDDLPYLEFGPIVDGLYTEFTGIVPFTFTENLLWISFFWLNIDANGIPLPSSVDPGANDTQDLIHAITRIQVRS